MSTTELMEAIFNTYNFITLLLHDHILKTIPVWCNTDYVLKGTVFQIPLRNVDSSLGSCPVRYTYMKCSYTNLSMYLRTCWHVLFGPEFCSNMFLYFSNCVLLVMDYVPLCSFTSLLLFFFVGTYVPTLLCFCSVGCEFWSYMFPCFSLFVLMSPNVLMFYCPNVLMF